MVDYNDRHGFNKRYKQRRDSGKPGWSDDYEKKGRELLKVLEQHNAPQSGKFLELGCGAGNISLFMAEKGYEAFGIDIIPEAIEWAKDRTKASVADAEFHLGSVVELSPFESGFFDIIWDEACLHCIIGTDRKTCFSNIFRILKPGGFFTAGGSLVNKTTSVRIQISDDRYFDPETRCVFHGDKPFYQLSTEEELKAEIQNAGFRFIDSQQSPGDADESEYKHGNITVIAKKPE